MSKTNGHKELPAQVGQQIEVADVLFEKNRLITMLAEVKSELTPRLHHVMDYLMDQTMQVQGEPDSARKLLSAIESVAKMLSIVNRAQ